MKRAIILGVGLLAAATAPVMAADIPMKAPIVAPPVAAVYNWTGFYIGGNAGWGWGRAEYLNTANTTFFVTLPDRLPSLITPMGSSAADRSATTGKPAASFSASKRCSTGPTSRAA
jgi:opacity protein-like surface antigen